jgi:hypothetical protein
MDRERALCKPADSPNIAIVREEAMTTRRREFLKATLAAAGAVSSPAALEPQPGRSRQGASGFELDEATLEGLRRGLESGKFTLAPKQASGPSWRVAVSTRKGVPTRAAIRPIPWLTLFAISSPRVGERYRPART